MVSNHLFFSIETSVLCLLGYNSPFNPLLVSNIDIYCFLFYSVFQPSVLESCVHLDNILLRITIDTLLIVFFFQLSFTYKKSVLTSKLFYYHDDF